MRRHAAAGLALAASIVLLAGCSAAPSLPPGLTPAGVKALIDEQNAAWWNGMFPDEPQPVIEPVSYDTYEVQGPRVEECMLTAGIPGVTVSGNGGYIFDPNDREVMDAFNRQMYICMMTYPAAFDFDAPEERGYYSPEQLAFIYDYVVERTMPCLNMLGYTMPEPPNRETFIETFYVSGYSLPYYQLSPGLTDTEAWERVLLRCPPPPIGQWYFPTGGSFE
ncbi:MAG: hypothetical protein JWP85_788 [Rhodoglobus sp.]|nr:hypothetical protein [Rhodoglobus sp.]